METSTVNQQTYHLKYAGFWIRFWAYLVDLIVVSSLGMLVINPVFRAMHWEISNPIFLLFTPYKITMLFVLFIYFLLMTKFFNQTLGKMIFGIRVQSATGESLTWSQLVFREVIGRFLSKFLYIPYLTVIFMPKKEALHDYFADTFVVHEAVYEQERPPLINEPTFLEPLIEQ